MVTIKEGMTVRYHPIIGGKHDGNLYTVRAVGELHGRAVAWLTGKSGCVDARALSVPQPGQDNYGLGFPDRPASG
jgi:hypothetical protein